MKIEAVEIGTVDATGEAVVSLTLRCAGVATALALLTRLEAGEVLVTPPVPDSQLKLPVVSDPVVSDPVVSDPVGSAPVGSAPVGSAPVGSAPKRAVREKVTPPKAAQVPAAPTPVPAQVPAAPTPVPAAPTPVPVPAVPAPAQVTPDPAPAQVDVPPELLAASSFRHVMVWMLANGFTTKEAIASECARLHPHVPAIARLGGDILDRIGRALEVLLAEQGVA